MTGNTFPLGMRGNTQDTQPGSWATHLNAPEALFVPFRQEATSQAQMGVKGV